MLNLEGIEFGIRSILGIFAGGVANFFLGGLWYMVLFSKRWIAATGRTPEDFKDGSPGGGLLLTLAGCIVTSIALAVVYQWSGGQSVMDGLVVGALLGSGIAAMEGMKAAIYSTDERASPWTLYAINGSYAICGLTVAGIVYALIT